MTARPPFQRFDVLSQSESGLNYVHDRTGNVTRVLTPSELEDFQDPKPCDECGEQFGCEHFNCAGEPLLSEAELESVPAQWSAFAKEHGISRNDLTRLQQLEMHEDEWRVTPGTNADMRAQELVILLNDFR
jgi:hypothetical protein